jgi:mono/diheme cytochrome c family protein
MRKAFYILNFAILGSFVAALIVDNNREWKTYQKEFTRREIERVQGELASAKDEKARASLAGQLDNLKHRPLAIKQIMATDLGRVDRCVTCHVGLDEIANPSLVTPYKEHPYMSKAVDVHKTHDLKKFGCTSCHSGQGLALTVEAAHGPIEHWEAPLLKNPYLQASCVKCHANYRQIKGTEIAVKGRDLITKNGCVGCHSFKGVGGVISVDLADVADKPLSRIDFSGTGLDRKDYSIQNWIELHFTKDTMQLVPGDPEGHLGEPIPPSGMPPFYEVLSKEDAQAITTYLLSQTAEKIPHDFYVYAPPEKEPAFSSPVEHGKFVFQKFGCAGCHGIGGAGGRRNFNARGPNQKEMKDGREPTLVDVVGTFTRDELRTKIQNGVPSSAVAKFNPEGPTPPLYMPTWGEKIKGQELEDLLSYLQSIAKKDEAAW